MGKGRDGGIPLLPSLPLPLSLGFMRFSRGRAAPEINRLRLPTAADRERGRRTSEPRRSEVESWRDSQTDGKALALRF